MTIFRRWFKKPEPAIEQQEDNSKALQELLQEAVDAAFEAHGDKVKRSKLFQRATEALESGSDAKVAEVLLDMLAYNWNRPDLPEADEAGLCKIMEALLAYRRSLLR